MARTLRPPKEKDNPEFWCEGAFNRDPSRLAHESISVIPVHLRERDGRLLHTTFAYAWWPQTSIKVISDRVQSAAERTNQNYMATTRGLNP